MVAETYLQCLLLSTFIWTLAALVDCPFKECGCDDDNILCEGKGLSEIPQIVGSRFGKRFLKMQTNNITTIPAGKLPANLTEISLLSNPIVNVDIAAFDDSAYTLETLSFSEARFTKIPDAILHLRGLRSFAIYDTTIEDWNDDVVIKMSTTVESLSLVNVSLRAWPIWIRSFSHLYELSVQSNFISYIPDDAFDASAATLMTTLDLSKNNLTMVPKSLSALTSLMNLDLGYNRIYDITWLPVAKGLSSISLMHNKIVDSQHLSDVLRPFADFITSVSVFGNELTEIPDFSFMFNLADIDLSNNKISDPKSGALPELMSFILFDFNSLPAIPSVMFSLPIADTIDVSYNSVTSINKTGIPIWVRELDMEYNLITELTDDSFPESSALATLVLMGNPIAQISRNAFKNVPNLTILNLQGTKISRLPESLLWLPSLNWLDVTECANLVCSCAEKDLGPWILSRQTGLQGKCGDSSIYNFFQVLSVECPA